MWWKRADLILADEPSVEAYEVYFESQMHRGKVRRLVDTSVGVGLHVQPRRPNGDSQGATRRDADGVSAG
jgi:hypothetical protein